MAFLLQSVAVQALPPEPTTDPAHPLARELMSAYALHYDIYKRGDLDALRQRALDAGGTAEEMSALREWFTRWGLKLVVYLMLDPDEGQFAAVDVTQTGDSARLIYVRDGGKQKRFFAAILRNANGTWLLGPTVSKTNESTVPEGLDELRSETDEQLCSASGSDDEGAHYFVERHGSDETGYRVACREVEREESEDVAI